MTRSLDTPETSEVTQMTSAHAAGESSDTTQLTES